MIAEDYPEFEGVVPLHSAEAEMSAIGAMLLSEDRAIELVEILSVGDFYRPANRLIFKAMEALVRKNMVIDQVTLENELKARGDLANIGGPDYLLEIGMYVPSAANAEYYAKILRDKTVRREGIKACDEAKTALQHGKDLDLVIELAKAIPAQIETRVRERNDVDIYDLIQQEPSREKPLVISSGNPHLDELLPGGGLTCGQFSLSTAGSGKGKSTWAMSAVFMALERKERCAILSFTDLRKEHIIQRGCRFLTGIDGTASCRSDAERRLMADALNHMYSEWDWVVYDADSAGDARNIETASAWLLRKQAEGLARPDDHRFEAKPLRLVDWDYAQDIRTSDKDMRGRSQYEKQCFCAQNFRNLTAKMKTAHAIMCAQLTIDGDKEVIRDCKEWEFGTELWLRVTGEGLKVKKRRFGGDTDRVAPHHHHPNRWVFVPDGGQWVGRFQA